MFCTGSLSQQQKWAKNRIKSLLNFRKGQPAITAGKLIHYGPEDGVYVYFRVPEDNTDSAVMVVMNKNDSATSLSLARFSAILEDYDHAVKLKDSQVVPLSDTLMAEARSALVFELRHKK